MSRRIYTPSLRPRAKQLEALAKMRGHKAFALLMAMRTGKTKTLLDDFGQLELDGETQDAAIIAPGGVYRTWMPAAMEHLSLDLRSRAAFHVWESGGGVRATKLLKAFLAINDRPRFLFINVEALSSVKAARETIKEFLKPKLSSRKSLLGVDESTVIKNHSSARTKFVVQELSFLAEYRRILSGLPTPVSPLDIFSQFEFLDWRILGHKSFYSFRARYAIMEKVNFGGRRDVPLIKGFRDIDEIYRKIEPYSFRVRLEDCYDLPPKDYSFREVALTEEQARLYKEMKAYATALIEGDAHVTATIVIAQILRLHQILCGHVTDENGVVHEIPENRTASLLQLLEDYDGKAIIWCSYDTNVRKVAAALEKEYGPGSVARFWGGNVKTREDEERQFQTDPKCRWMVATQSAGGRGRMWAVANLTVYYSSTNNLDHRSQSEERAQNVGKTESVAYVDMIAPGTVEEKIIFALRQKINMASVITGDSYKEWLI